MFTLMTIGGDGKTHSVLKDNVISRLNSPSNHVDDTKDKVDLE